MHGCMLLRYKTEYQMVKHVLKLTQPRRKTVSLLLHVVFTGASLSNCFQDVAKFMFALVCGALLRVLTLASSGNHHAT
jgi:hypothetical protein